jgi:hypothetical protein
VTGQAAVVSSVWVFDAMCLSHCAAWVLASVIYVNDGRISPVADNLGEASVFAAAELRSATAITDDPGPVRVARKHGLDTHGTIWLLAGCCRNGKLSEIAGGNLIDALRATGLRLPCTGGEFPDYARQHGLL